MKIQRAFKAVASVLLAYTLLPTTEIDNGYTVTIDKAPSEPLGRSVAVQEGATITVTASNGKKFAAVLMGPAGIMDTTNTSSWSAKLVRPGGYRLQFGSETDIYASHSVVDFVVVPDPTTVAAAGTGNADALYTTSPDGAGE